MINTNATEPSAKADFTVGGISGRFRTLSMLEWKYIFNGKNDRSWKTGSYGNYWSLAPWYYDNAQVVLFDCQYTFFNFMETLRWEGCAIRLVENVTE